MADASSKTSPAPAAIETAPSPWPGIAVAVVVLAALAATFTYEQDFDIFWHLKAGQWMLDHQQVLDHDPFTAEPDSPNTPWVNVYWLFQLIVAGSHRLGGFAALSALKALCAGAAMLAFGLSLRKRIPAAALVLAGLLTAAVMAERVRVRPEMFTLLFLTLAVVLVDGVRRGGPPRRLWWLVPIMIAWINMHGLYFLGLAVMWLGLAGAALDRALGRKGLAGNLPTQAALAPIVAATAACLISPWPLESMLQPLILWTRISGEGIYYVYGVSELQRTWEALGNHLDAVALVGAMTLAMLVHIRKMPLGHLLWAIPFVALALLARRNVGLMAPVCGYLLAWHGGAMLRAAAVHAPNLGRAAGPLAALATLAGLAVSAGYATGYIFRIERTNDQLGAGLAPHQYPIELAQYLGDLPAKGDLLNLSFGDASTFIEYSYPARKVWMDGRLEIHSTGRFHRLQEILTDLRQGPGAAARVVLPRSVRFVVARYDDARISSLMNAPAMRGGPDSRRFKLVRLDGVAACFADTQWTDARPEAEIAAELPLTANVKDFDLPLHEDGRIGDLPAVHRRWYRQNPVSMYARIASMMLSLGQVERGPDAGPNAALQRRCSLLAVRYYEAARIEGTQGEAMDNYLLAQALQQWALACGESAGVAAPIDISLARALYLTGQVDLAAVPPENVFTLGLLRIQGLAQGRHLEAAWKTVVMLGDLLPPRQRVSPPQDYVDLRNSLTAMLEHSRGAERGLKSLPLAKRVAALAGADMGLTDQAISELKSIGRADAATYLTLGDLLLRQGRAGEAHDAYSIASSAGADETEIALRMALCLWVQGQHYPAGEAMKKIANEKNHAVARYYLGRLLEELGRYSDARAALTALASPAAGKELEAKARAVLSRLDQP